MEQAHNEIDALRRLRVLEERFVNLRRKAQLADEKVLNSEKRLNTEIKEVNAELTQLRRQVSDMRDSLDAVQSEMANAASVYDVKALERYLEYWEPMEFVTKIELSRKQNLLKLAPGKKEHAD